MPMTLCQYGIVENENMASSVTQGEVISEGPKRGLVAFFTSAPGPIRVQGKLRTRSGRSRRRVCLTIHGEAAPSFSYILAFVGPRGCNF